MRVKFEKLADNAVLPTYAKPGDAGLDLTATSAEFNPLFTQYGTGIAVEIPEGHVGLLFPRSSVTKTSLMLKNSIVVIDSGYRGEIMLRFQDVSGAANEIVPLQKFQVGDKIGQLVIVPIPTIEPVWSLELTETERGDGGFGSTGN